MKHRNDKIKRPVGRPRKFYNQNVNSNQTTETYEIKRPVGRPREATFDIQPSRQYETNQRCASNRVTRSQTTQRNEQIQSIPIRMINRTPVRNKQENATNSRQVNFRYPKPEYLPFPNQCEENADYDYDLKYRNRYYDNIRNNEMRRRRH